MSVDTKIAAAFVEIATKGLAKVQSDLDKLKGHLNQSAGGSAKLETETKKAGEQATKTESAFKRLGDTIGKIGAIAAKGFFGATAAITGFVKMASPKGFDDLTVALASLSIQLGRIFVPLLDQVTAKINALVSYFKGLTDAQREQILHWTKVGLAVAGVLLVLPRVLSLVNIAVSGFKLVGVAISALRVAVLAFGSSMTVATGGISLVIGLLAAAIPLALQFFGSVKGGGATGVFAKIAGALGQLWNTIKTAFTRIATTVFNALAKIGEAILPVIEDLVRSVVPVLESLWATVAKVFSQIATFLAETFATIAKTVIPIFAQVATVVLKTVAQIAQALAPVIGAILKALSPIVQWIAKVVALVAGALIPVVSTILEAATKIISAILPVITGLIDALAPVITQIIDLFSDVIEACKPLMDAVLEVARTLIEALVPIVQIVVNAIKVALSVLIPIFKLLITVVAAVVKIIALSLKVAFEFLAKVVHALVSAYRYAANALIDLANGLIDWYNRQKWLPGTLDRLNRLTDEEAKEKKKDVAEMKQTTIKQKQETKKDSNRFRGDVRQPAAELLGIADFWKKIQTAQGIDAQSRIQREQLDQSKRNGNALDKIANNTTPKNQLVGTGAAI